MIGFKLKSLVRLQDLKLSFTTILIFVGFQSLIMGWSDPPKESMELSLQNAIQIVS